MNNSDLGKLSMHLWTILGAWILIAIGSSPLALSQNTQDTNSESWLGTLNVGAVISPASTRLNPRDHLKWKDQAIGGLLVGRVELLEALQVHCRCGREAVP
ncbi:MAG: hypothetical protein ACI814_001833 [Mariniblastus sp.]|jgi:hypothetical protein